MEIEHEVVDVEVDGARLGGVRWAGDPDAPTAVALHGITANAWSWAAVARHLAGRVSLVAVDLRGRGRSHAAAGPFGIRAHADDVAAVVDRLAGGRAVVAGHSMGAHVAVALAHRHADRVDRLVLVDGGPPLALPDGVAPADAIDVIVGPAVARLDVTWPDRAAYRAMWAGHPAFAGGLTPEIERYVLADLVPTDDGFRSHVNADAVRLDGTQLAVDDELRDQFAALDRPAIALRAETGILAEPPPFVADEWVERFAQHDWRSVPGTNHYDLLIGETGAAAVADAIVDAVVEARPGTPSVSCRP